MGEAAAFADPYYSVGSNMIGFANGFTRRLIESDRQGRLTSEYVDYANRFFLTLNDSLTDTIHRTYPFHQNGPLMAPEGCVGAGTGMQTFGFAGGIGTASRQAPVAGKVTTVGALVLSNFGQIEHLRVDGRHVGRMLAPRYGGGERRPAAGSIIVLLAYDAPLLARQLSRVCRRAALALGRIGGFAAHNSGEVLLAWSTANRVPRSRTTPAITVEIVLDAELDALYEATVDVVEEAILNAMFGGTAMRGQSDHRVEALPVEEVRAMLEGW